MRNILYTILVLFVIGLLQVHAQALQDVPEEASGFLQGISQDVPAVDGGAEASGRSLQECPKNLTVCAYTPGCTWCPKLAKCIPRYLCKF